MREKDVALGMFEIPCWVETLGFIRLILTIN